MERYRNLGGNSGIREYEIGPDSIKVSFPGKEPYLYTHRSAGQIHIERMKRLAVAGRGLGTYISKYVGDKYER